MNNRSACDIYRKTWRKKGLADRQSCGSIYSWLSPTVGLEVESGLLAILQGVYKPQTWGFADLQRARNKNVQLRILQSRNDSSEGRWHTVMVAINYFRKPSDIEITPQQRCPMQDSVWDHMTVGPTSKGLQMSSIWSHMVTLSYGPHIFCIWLAVGLVLLNLHPSQL